VIELVVVVVVEVVDDVLSVTLRLNLPELSRWPASPT
jgi:hypothetical protein